MANSLALCILYSRYVAMTRCADVHARQNSVVTNVLMPNILAVSATTAVTAAYAAIMNAATQR